MAMSTVHGRPEEKRILLVVNLSLGFALLTPLCVYFAVVIHPFAGYFLIAAMASFLAYYFLNSLFRAILTRFIDLHATTADQERKARRLARHATILRRSLFVAAFIPGVGIVVSDRDPFRLVVAIGLIVLVASLVFLEVYVRRQRSSALTTPDEGSDS